MEEMAGQNERLTWQRGLSWTPGRPPDISGSGPAEHCCSGKSPVDLSIKRLGVRGQRSANLITINSNIHGKCGRVPLDNSAYK